MGRVKYRLRSTLLNTGGDSKPFFSEVLRIFILGI